MKLLIAILIVSIMGCGIAIWFFVYNNTEVGILESEQIDSSGIQTSIVQQKLSNQFNLVTDKIILQDQDYIFSYRTATQDYMLKLNTENNDEDKNEQIEGEVVKMLELSYDEFCTLPVNVLTVENEESLFYSCYHAH